MNFQSSVVSIYQKSQIYETLRTPMAEHIYSKSTRVWFSDKEQGWISAEVTSITRGANDTFKIVFVDERGKASLSAFYLS